MQIVHLYKKGCTMFSYTLVIKIASLLGINLRSLQ